jgi:hypothetical protein
MAQKPVIEFLKGARLMGPSGSSVCTDWQDVPEGFAPESLVVVLNACVGSTFLTTTLHTCPPAPLLEVNWREAEPDVLEYQRVRPAVRVCSPGFTSSELCVEMLDGRVRVNVEVDGGFAGRFDVILSVLLFGRE